MPENAARNAGHAVAEELRRHGVAEIFGQDSPEWLYEAIDPETIRPVTMRDERSAGFAADAVARLTRRPAVACGIHGPGALNLTTALFEAREANSPLVALVSDVETTVRGRGAFQEVDMLRVVAPIVKWAARPERPADVAPAVARALRTSMSGCPGPVLVALPNDVLGGPVGPARPSPNAPFSVPTGIAPAMATRAAAVLAEARSPVLLLGNGARIAGAGAAAIALAERLSAPMTVTAMARGVITETHPLYAGVAGFMSDAPGGSGSVANPRLATADVVLVVGSDLDGATTDGGRLPASDSTVIRIDVDPDRLARSPREQLSIAADARLALEAINKALHAAGPGPRDRSAPAGELARQWAEVRAAQASAAAAPGPAIAPAHLYADLRGTLPEGALVVCDAGYSSIWALSALAVGRDVSAITYGRAAGTLGFGLPGAIGAQVAHPGRRVVAIVGDGGFGFGWGELETLARERLPVVVVVLNNGCFAYQRLWHDLNDRRPRWLDFADVRHDRLASAVGIPGWRVTDPGRLTDVLRAAFAQDGPALVDVVIDPEAMPPFNAGRHAGR
ncbi:thiamine pyrophosphate-binding protein [Streptosporangium sp. CA-115845]|uniref:thiamine pyrophosphate-binding protein n=1 Tax=Streptosporangium sp. CA-115845 TaxID=3240071 RepID=UPI003D944E07